MKVQHIQQNINFEAKKRFIDLESKEQLTQILRKMDKETVYASNEYTFEISKTKRLELFNHNKDKKIAELVDARQNMERLPEGKDMIGTTSLTIGETQLAIDNKSGEILAWHKPFFSSWKNVMKKINDTLITINNVFHNSALVKKHKLGICGFTQKGFEALQKLTVK